MSDYAYGEPVPMTLTDTAGNVATLASYTEVVLTIVQPDGTTLVKKKSDASLTANPYNFTWTQVGRHTFEYVTTGPDGGTVAQPFDTHAAGEAGIISLTDAKTQLRIPSTDTSRDTQIQGWIASLTPMVEDVVGPVVRATKDEWYDGGSPTILLRHEPIISVTSITEYVGHTGVALTEQPLTDATGDGYGYTVELPEGIVIRRGIQLTWPATINPWLVGNPVPFYPGIRNVHIVYVVGRTIVPANIKQGAEFILEHLWRTSQQGYSSTFGAPPSETELTYTPSGYLIPYKAMEALKPSARRRARIR
jgi:hypothetical protein